MDDTYKTIKEPSEGQTTEKKSKFLAFAFPVGSVDDAKTIVDEYRKKYYDARHVCWAYMLGAEGESFRANDDGEPSGTAGKPILGQIKSYGITDVLVLVVRYFGGIKLGTSGLISAYKEAASQALADAEIIEKTVDENISFTFPYPVMNSVMKIIKEIEPRIITQNFDMDCRMSLQIRKSLFEPLKQKLEKVESLHFEKK